MTKENKIIPKDDITKEKQPGNQTEETLENPDANQSGIAALYRKDPRTGEWVVQNPAGSIGYNYLYRGDDDFDL